MRKVFSNLESVSKNKNFSKVNVQNIDLLNSNSVENMMKRLNQTSYLIYQVQVLFMSH